MLVKGALGHQQSIFGNDVMVVCSLFMQGLYIVHSLNTYLWQLEVKNISIELVDTSWIKDINNPHTFGIEIVSSTAYLLLDNDILKYAGRHLSIIKRQMLLCRKTNFTRRHCSLFITSELFSMPFTHVTTYMSSVWEGVGYWVSHTVFIYLWVEALLSLILNIQIVCAQWPKICRCFLRHGLRNPWLEFPMDFHLSFIPMYLSLTKLTQVH